MDGQRTDDADHGGRAMTELVRNTGWARPKFLVQVSSDKKTIQWCRHLLNERKRLIRNGRKASIRKNAKGEIALFVDQCIYQTGSGRRAG